MGMSGVNDETEIIANVDDVINIEGTKDLIPIPSSTFKSTGCDNLLLFDQYYQMTTVRTKNRFNGSTIQRWSFISCFDDNSGIVVVYDMGIEKQITARAVSSILVVKMCESANAHLSSTVGIALIFRFVDETSRVSLSTIKEGIFKVKIVAGHINLGVRRGYEVSNGFRLLVMGRMNCSVDVKRTMLIRDLIENVVKICSRFSVVEEEMLMRKFHELMKAQAVNKKNENNGNISTALVDPACIEGDETGNSAPSVLVKSKEQL
ncbi:hypothetical protein Goshw_016518 [Gossypium schwendimanii]|uniref:Uncharacterized protein n=1 Tax=Gossypium schwendimanii TaxID=34291 RepID=A0A7J9KYK4_GOSSC|nr:hypothetical protein [Gossypium schwendimanii]